MLSPHRNDAAFSLGLSLESWLAAKFRVTVLGVFTRSATAPFSDAETVHPNDLLSYVSGLRRKEDAELLKLLPKLRMEDLNLKDAPIRLRCAADEAYGLAPRADDPAIEKIRKGLAKINTVMKVDAVVLPLGLGHHVDHLIVQHAVVEFGASRACAFYEDLPDALRDGDGGNIDDAIGAELASLGEALGPAIQHGTGGGEAAIKRKFRLTSKYASQADEPTMRAISSFGTRYGGGERIWVNAAWATDERLIAKAVVSS